MSSRYTDYPFLRLLELYVLSCIGYLSDKDKRWLESITPGLQKTYQRQGTWSEIIVQEMDFPANMPQLLQNLWEKNQAIAASNKTNLTPEMFAQMIVDTNMR